MGQIEPGAEFDEDAMLTEESPTKLGLTTSMTMKVADMARYAFDDDEVVEKQEISSSEDEDAEDLRRLEMMPEIQHTTQLNRAT
jgi:hypothetical protein